MLENNLKKNGYTHKVILKNWEYFKVWEIQYNEIRSQVENSRWFITIVDLFTERTLYDWKISEIQWFKTIEVEEKSNLDKKIAETKNIENKILKLRKNMTDDEKQLLKENAFNEIKRIEKQFNVKYSKEVFIYLLILMEKKLIRENYL